MPQVGVQSSRLVCPGPGHCFRDQPAGAGGCGIQRPNQEERRLGLQDSQDTEAGESTCWVRRPGRLGKMVLRGAEGLGCPGAGTPGSALGGRWASGAAGLAASAPSHWSRRLSVSSAWSNARALGAGPSADAAVSRCCRDAAAGAAALTLREHLPRSGTAAGRAGTRRGPRGVRRPIPLASYLSPAGDQAVSRL